jgi:hypothetical protein
MATAISKVPASSGPAVASRRRKRRRINGAAASAGSMNAAAIVQGASPVTAASWRAGIHIVPHNTAAHAIATVAGPVRGCGEDGCR